MIRIVLAGNQNCGKSTLFNALTGENQHVGNWPGVTVEKQIGMLRGHPETEVIDLPGTYSLTPYTGEERVTREALLEGDYAMVVNVIDATSLERSLYLTLQLIELGVPMLAVLNMMDDSRRRGDRIDVPRLSALLGVPVIPVSARTGEGIKPLVEHLAAPCAERKQAPKTPQTPAAAAIDQRYRRIAAILDEAFVPGRTQRTATERIDRVVMHPLLGVPILIIMMMCVLWLVFGPLGSAIAEGAEGIVSAAGRSAASWLGELGASPRLTAFVTEGLLSGVGSVMSFLPTMMLLLLCLSILEDCGFMARAAFLMDWPLRCIGLSGRAFIPMLLGLGCTAPAAMAARAMAGRRDRILTTLLLPFMSCSAKLPVYALLSQSMFGSWAWMAVGALYLGGIFMGMAAALVIGRKFGDSPAPLLMEMPIYRMPTLRAVFRGLANRAWEFLRRVFTVILLSAAAVWFLRSCTPALQWTDDARHSLLGLAGGMLAPLFIPLGLDSPEIVASLMTGVLAKESIVSTLTLLTDGRAVSLLRTPASAMAFLTFVMLYTPCVTALTAMADTLGSWRSAARSALMQLMTAWLAAFMVYRLCCA